MRCKFQTADVFTDTRFGGNQLAVIPEAQGLSGDQMQQLAREFNYSETVFVLPADSGEADFCLRIFTPEEELPFAGHPTIGAAFILATSGRIELVDGAAQSTFRLGAGLVPVRMRLDGHGRFHAELTTPRRPEFGPAPPSIEALAAIVGLEPHNILTTRSVPRAVSCGLPFLIVPLDSIHSANRVSIDTARWRSSLANSWASMLCLFTTETLAPEADLHVRVFCPGLGIPEDPATGSAAAALGGYLASLLPEPAGTFRWTIEQGVELGRPSRIEVAVDKVAGSIAAVRVGGAAVAVMSGEIEL
ncbi:MAG: hypothetical protein RIR52_790 [Acidobacteriota bacterium]|jgi:trans-2,3-dihydro-3-hydroxyanthranilate isomerase